MPSITPEITITRAALTEATSLALITALNAELSALYPEPGANHSRQADPWRRDRARHVSRDTLHWGHDQDVRRPAYPAALRNG